MTQPGGTTDKNNKGGTGPSRLTSILLILIIIGVSVAAALLWQNLRQSYEKLQSGNNTTQQTSVDVTPKFRAVDARIDELAQRILKLEQEPPAAGKTDETSKTVAADKTYVNELSYLKSEVLALTTTVTNLESRLKQTTSAANSSQRQALAALVNSLSALADTGHGFEHELDFLKHAIDSYYPDLREPAARLEAVAATGAPNIAALRNELAEIAPLAENEIRKARAVNWLDRIIAELRGMVTIRSLHPKPGQGSTLDAIVADLDRKKLDDAIQKADDLPEAAKNTLKNWRKEAAARQTIDNVMAQITQYLTEQSEGEQQ